MNVKTNTLNTNFLQVKEYKTPASIFFIPLMRLRERYSCNHVPYPNSNLHEPYNYMRLIVTTLLVAVAQSQP